MYPDNDSVALDKLEKEIGDNFETKKYMEAIGIKGKNQDKQVLKQF